MRFTLFRRSKPEQRPSLINLRDYGLDSNGMLPDDMQNFSVKIGLRQYNRITQLAKEAKASRSDVVRYAIDRLEVE